MFTQFPKGNFLSINPTLTEPSRDSPNVHLAATSPRHSPLWCICHIFQHSQYPQLPQIQFFIKSNTITLPHSIQI